MIKKLIRTSLFAIILLFLILYLETSFKDIAIIHICNAFFIPGFIILLFGVLISLSNSGSLKGLSYLGKTLTSMFKSTPKQSYYDHINSDKEKVQFIHHIIIGSSLILVSIIIMIAAGLF